MAQHPEPPPHAYAPHGKACTPPHVSLALGGARRPEVAAPSRARWAWAGLALGLAALGLAGAGLMVWWAVAFHPADEQLWMVPVGLVLLGTPLVAWLSIFASGACRGLRSEPPPVAAAVIPER